MDPGTYRIPLEAAHQILATFGITKPTRAYERWVKDDGFDLKDFNEVLFESPFIFIIDWRACLDEELEIIQGSLGELDVEVELALDENGDSGEVLCGGRQAAVAYRPSDEDELDDVIRALQSVMPDTIEFRADPGNIGSDTSVYAVLPTEEWAELEQVAREVVRHFFGPVPAKA